MKLTISEEKQLLNVAHHSILEQFMGHKISQRNLDDYPEALTKSSGAFVSIFTLSQLRGCIGQLKSTQAIVHLVAHLSREAARNDFRFTPIEKHETKDLSIEISILTPPRRIKSIKEIEIGKHGLYIQSGSHQGVLLPQVAFTQKWSVLQFLEFCSEHKAGLRKDGWKNAELFIFEACLIRSHQN